MKALTYILSLILITTCLSSPVAAKIIQAASCSQEDVQAAVNAASDGDVVLIPNGSCEWTVGISTTKQIRIEAQYYTPTPGGNTTRNVIITNNSSSMPLFSFTTGNSYHVGISGIRFNEGTGSNNHLEVIGSGSKVALVNDIYFEVKERYGNSHEIAAVDWRALGGVIWNTRFVGLGPTGVGGASFYISSPRGWTTPSTMGSLDTNGSVNVYLEDSSCLNCGSFPDNDPAGRAVWRYNDIDGCNGTMHGFTSVTTGRHIEYYNNTFSVTTEERNHVGRYFWLRGGTALFTDNVVNNASNPGYYGNISLLNVGENNPSGPYPIPMQPGWGHNGTDHVSDPVYIWNNSGSRGSTWWVISAWENHFILNRDIFVDSGPKPGYSKYTYPHPLRNNPTFAEEDELIVKDFVLYQNYPNPFNPTTVISYQLPVSGMVTLKVYDILGNEIATVVNEYKSAGTYEVEFDAVSHSDEGRNLASGIYFYQLKIGGTEINSGQGIIQIRKMVLIR